MKTTNSTSRRPRGAILLAFALLAALALATSASARPVFGLQGINPGTSRTALKHQLDGAARVGVRQLRVGVEWRSLQPTGPDTYDQGYLASIDQVVDGAAARHIKVVLFATQTPCWGSTAPAALKAQCAGGTTPYSVYRYPPADPATFARMSAFLVGRYASKLAAYQIWNEPDQSNENYWAGPNKVASYVALVKATYQPVKQAAPGVPVLAGSFVGGNGKWLQAMYDAGIKGYYDGLAVHFYDLPLNALKTTRAVQLHNGDRTPQWLTEFGWNSCYRKGGPAYRATHRCVSRAVQARALGDLARATRRTSWISSEILYQIDDENTDYQFGVFDRSGRAKPLYSVLSALAHGRVGTRMPRPSVRLRVRNGQLIASGHASIVDIYNMTAKVNGVLRFRATFRSNRTGAWTIKFPKIIGTANIKVRVASNWSPGAVASASR